jgi:hypothetical protein
MRNSLIPFLLILPLNLFSADHYRPSARSIHEGEYEIVWENTYSQTRSRWNVEGTEVIFEEDEGYDILDSQLSLAISFTQDLEFQVGARARKVDSARWDGTQIQEVSNSGMESAFFSALFTLGSANKVLYGLSFSYRQALYSNPGFDANFPDDFVVLGDGGRDISAGGAVSILHNNGWWTSFKGLYRNPSEDLANEGHFIYEGAKIWAKSAFYWGLHYLYSLGNDTYETSIPYTTGVDNKPEIGRGAGYRFNSVNRQWTEVYAGLNLRLSGNWQLRFRSGYKVAGQSTDQSLDTSVSLVLSPRTSRAGRKRDQFFKEYLVEADVEKVSASQKFIVINKGLEDGVRKGMIFDIFDFDFEGGNQLLAKARAYTVNASETILQVVERFRRVKITTKHVVRGR